MGRFTSIFWETDGTGDGVPYPQELLTQWQRMLWVADPTVDAVVSSFLNELEVTNPSGLQLQVNTGGCIAYGFPAWLPAVANHYLTLPIVGTTGWRLVIRVDWEPHTIQTYLLQSADGTAGSPDATFDPGTRYEIGIAHGTVTVAGEIIVGDDRAYVEPASIITSDRIDRNSLTPLQFTDRTRRFWCAAVDAYDGTGEPTWHITVGRGWEFADAITTVGYGAFNVPTDYVSGMVVRAVIFGDAGGGNFYLYAKANYGADAELYNIHSATFPIAAVANPGAGIMDEVAEIAMASVSVGDSISLFFEREGGSGSDTATGLMVFPGWIVEYTADG